MDALNFEISYLNQENQNTIRKRIGTALEVPMKI